MLPALISAGANLASGILGRNQNKQNIKLQKEFAQHGIRWKVEDAKQAGIHPLAALGAQTHSFAPSSVGGSSLAGGVAAAGQDISRAVNATRTAPERVDAYTKTVQDLNVQRLGLENQLLSSQIAKINQAGSPPPMPSAVDPYLMEGQTESGIKEKPHERVSSALGHPWQEPGAITDVGYTRTRTGHHPVMSKDAKERLEEDMIGTILWNIRNRLGPALGGTNTPPSERPPVGKEWWFNPNTFEYQLRDARVKWLPRRQWTYPDHP